jgi:hypothetical protein
MPVRRGGFGARRGIPLHLWIAGVAAIVWTVALLALAVAVSPGAHAASRAHTLPPRAAATATVQPTSPAFSQPTVGASTPVAPSTNTALGSNGLTIATILSCVTGILGLVIGLVALVALLRGGYGPFLRTLLPGARRRMARESRNASRSGHLDRRPAMSRGARNGREYAGPPPRRTGAPRSRR